MSTGPPERPPADGFGRGGRELPQSDHGTHAGLQFGQLSGELGDLADQYRADQEQGDQIGDAETVRR